MQPFAFWAIGPRSNPAWSMKAVVDRWRSVVKIVGKKMMPLPARRGGLREYGSGRYGTVLPTGTPGVVLKVTTDESEAYAAQWLAAQKRPPKGIVRYLRVLELPVTHRARTVYLLWREEALWVGGIGLWARKNGLAKQWRDEDRLLEQTTSTAQTLVQRLRRSPAQARAFRAAATRGFERAVTAPERAMARRFLALQRLPPGKSVETTVERVMLGARILSRGQVLPEVGGAMLLAFKRGVFFSDVHAGNIGVTRGVVVITDPGNAVPLSSRTVKIRRVV